MTQSPSCETLTFLYQAVQLSRETLGRDEFLQRVLDMTRQHYQLDAVSVAVVEVDGSLTFRAASGAGAEQVIGLHLPLKTGIVGWVAENGQRLWVPDVRTHPCYYSQVDAQTHFQTRSIHAEPVIAGGQTLAVLEVLNPGEEPYLSDLRAGLVGLAALIAPVIRSAQLAEQARHAEERYRHLFEYNASPILVLDRQGRLLEANSAARTLLDISVEQIGEPCLERIHITEACFNELKSQLETRDVLCEEVQFQTGGEPHSFEVTFSYIPPDTYQWLAHDVTMRVKLERARQYFTDMIVHDLRNPLSSIVHSLELLLTAWSEMDMTIPVAQVLTIALRSSHRMERLISDILDSARLRSKRDAIHISEIEVSSMVQEVLEILQSSIERREHTFTQNLPADMPMMHGDEDMLQRVLLNVLNNAIKFTPNGGKISLTVQVDEEFFRFIVRDNGPGIPQELQPYIFDVFVRGDTGNIKGSGLGLAFCKLAVEAHGGTIDVQSAPGEGSTFTFTLPHVLPQGLRGKV